jgi:hypothetical protein
MPPVSTFRCQGALQIATGTANQVSTGSVKGRPSRDRAYYTPERFEGNMGSVIDPRHIGGLRGTALSPLTHV